MFDRRSYLDTISALRADPDKLEEIIKMKENDRRHLVIVFNIWASSWSE